MKKIVIKIIGVGMLTASTSGAATVESVEQFLLVIRAWHVKRSCACPRHSASMSAALR